MDNSPKAIASRLSKIVDEYLAACSEGDVAVQRGRKQIILNSFNELRQAYRRGELSPDIVDRIVHEKQRSGIKDTESDYERHCWECWRKRHKEVWVDAAVDEKCPECGWARCPRCGACRDPQFGICHSRIKRPI